MTYPDLDAPAPPDYLHLERQPLWQQYNAWLDTGFEPFTRKADARKPRAVQLERDLEPHFVALYGGDVAARNRGIEFIKLLTDDMMDNPRRLELQLGIMRGIANMPPKDYQILGFLASRSQRWSRLAAQIGMPVPLGFRAYRGERGLDSVLDVAGAWEIDDNLYHYTNNYVASWSLERGTAERFSEFDGPQVPAVVFAADVPFDQTQADKFVDGSSFINPYWHQNEIVCGDSERQAVQIRTDLTLVRFKGVVYTQAQTQQLLTALSSDGQSWNES